MKCQKTLNLRSPTVTEWLYVVALLFHVVWCYWIAFSESIVAVVNFSRWLVNAYSAIGFKWSLNDRTTLIAAGLLSAVLVNALRRAIEGGVLGWPRFNAHDMGTLKVSTLRAIGYGLLCFFGLGAFGENESAQFVKMLNLIGHHIDLNMTSVAYISISTFILGCFVNALDDAISALVINISRRT